MKLKDEFIRVLFPQKCVVCGEIVANGYVCGTCWDKLNRIKEPRCGVCGRPFGSEFAVSVCSECMSGKPYKKLFIPFEYNDGVKTAIRNMKFWGRAGNFRYFAREIALEMKGFRPDFITYVPQDRKTRFVRGYNQTELMAKELGKLMKVKVVPTLIRIKKGKKQVSLTRAQRTVNAKRLFMPMNKKLSGRWLIVDDVVTTGSTMEACCKLLKRMGCSEVYGAAVAKTVRG